MRKEYDLKSLKVKRRGPLPDLKKATRRSSVAEEAEIVKRSLLKDREFIRKVAEQVGR